MKLLFFLVPPPLRYLVFPDVLRLRREHRIVGNLIGLLPRAPRQIQFSGLPLQLLPEEVYILTKKGIGKLVVNPALAEKPGPKEQENYQKYLKESFEEQRVVG